jgi:hypothetical protein
MQRNTVKAGFLAFLSGLFLRVDAGVAPTITVSSSTTSFVNLANKTASGVINDPTDPLATLGINFSLTDEDVSSVVISCSSNKTSVVPNNVANLIFSGTGGLRNLKIKPTGVGYATLTVTVKDNESKTATYTLKYAASAAALDPSQNYYYTHLSSASTAIAVGNDYMFIGDDEYNELAMYDRHQSGMPVAKFDFTSSLNLPDASTTEVDIEASCLSPSNPNRMYWMGSMSNSKSGDQKPNRDRIFATDKTGTGISTKLSFVGYASLRAQVIKWGDANGYNLSASTKTGIIPKQIDGFSMEGLEFGPDNTTLFLGFRTPYVPVTNRTKALICPVLNFETWFNGGSPSGNPSFGSPIELDLGGRGIRSLGKNSANEYIIVAGAFDGTDNFALYKWTGKASDAPVKLTVDLTGLNPEGIVEVPATLDQDKKMELVSDDGTVDWYNDGTQSKDLTTFEFQKFAATWVTFPGSIASLSDETAEIQPGAMRIYPSPLSDVAQLVYPSTSNEKVEFRILDMQGKIVHSQTNAVSDGVQDIRIDCEGLPKGYYLLIAENTGKMPVRFSKK